MGFDLDIRSVKAQFRAATRSGARYTGVVNGQRMEVREGRARRDVSREKLPEWGRMAVIEKDVSTIPGA